MIAMFGTALLSLVLIVAAVLSWGDDYAPWLLAGGIVYIAGTILPTITYHVPRNDALAALDPEDPATAAYWERYQREWTGMNHVRTVRRSSPPRR